MKDGDKVWQLGEKVSYGQLYDEPALVFEGQVDAIVLNDTAACFIELCDGQRTVDEIIEMVVEDFEVSAEQLALDLQPFIDDMAKEGIIVGASLARDL